MNPRLIVIDGKTYNSIDEMPQDVRSRYEQALRTLRDQDGNRVPDVLEDNNLPAATNRDGNPDISEDIAGASLVNNILKVLVDGKEYTSLDDLPPDARAQYNQAMGALDANRNGIPDFVEGMTSKKQESTSAASLQNVSHTPMQTGSLETPETSNGWMLVLLGALLLFFCAATVLGAWYFFIR